MNSKNSLPGIIWDFDGVIVDTIELHFLSFENALKKYNVTFSREIYPSVFGKNNTGVIAYVMGTPPSPQLVDEITALKEEWFLAHLKEYATLLPGIPDWLHDLQQTGHKQAIASSAPYITIDPLVDTFDLRHYFNAIVSGYYLPSKPDPAVYLEAASKIGVAPERCVVIEDAIVGVEGAHRAGMKCIGVLTTNSAEDMRDADIITNNLAELSYLTISEMFQ